MQTRCKLDPVRAESLALQKYRIEVAEPAHRPIARPQQFAILKIESPLPRTPSHEQRFSPDSNRHTRTLGRL